MRKMPRDPIVDMYLVENYQLIEELEEAILESEKQKDFTESIDSIFRIMHTIKGNSAMMLFNNIATLAHSIEDLFDYIRNNVDVKVDYSSITDIILKSIDFIKDQMTKIEDNQKPDGDSSDIILNVEKQLNIISGGYDHTENTTDIKKQKYCPSCKNDENLINKKISNELDKLYEAIIFFTEGCQMENIRAFTIINNLESMAKNIKYFPQDIIENNESDEEIKKNGFKVIFNTDKSKQEIDDFFSQVAFLKEIRLSEINETAITLENNNKFSEDKKQVKNKSKKHIEKHEKLSTLNVNVEKLDVLMDLMGELVISEAMVTRNPDIKNYNLDNFNKASRQLRKIIANLQDVVMSIRMLPLDATFKKMNRIVRDMCKKLGKDVELKLVGEDTEVDKNIIEHISDPLMHIIRNSLDHGIELPEERINNGKESKGEVVLEARNSGGDVEIIIKDDGKGLDKEKILTKAREHGLIDKPEENLTDKEIFSFIFLPGFSTNDQVSEFSGRGVGMDVVTKNIEKIRGKISIESVLNKGTIVTIKIPLTLAIIEGMTVRIGQAIYTIPITAIRQSFRVKEKDVIKDIEGNEMIMVRGQCYPILRLHKRYNVKTNIKKIEDGILIMIENEEKAVCIFVDELLGEQQVVVKPLPNYIKKVKGISGCNLLGDGSISLILDVDELIL